MLILLNMFSILCKSDQSCCHAQSWPKWVERVRWQFFFVPPDPPGLLLEGEVVTQKFFLQRSPCPAVVCGGIL